MPLGEKNSADLPFRSGFVALCGRPNVGKSTLLNALIGQSLAVVSPRPQTTRERMLGIWSTPQFQAVLVDTPGMHQARSALNRHMAEEAKRAACDVDLLLLLAEAPQLRSREACQSWQPGPGAQASLELLKSIESLDGKIILVVTKCDQLVDKDHMFLVRERWQALHSFAEVLPVSATQGQGLDALRDEIASRLPVGPRYYDDDQLSDRNLRWHAAELIRGEVFRVLGQELPYSCAVTIDRFHEGLNMDRIDAFLHVERPSQKAIAIGHKGRTIRELSSSARKKIAEISGRSCDLRLQVRVEKNWTTSPEKLARLGYLGELAPVSNRSSK